MRNKSVKLRAGVIALLIVIASIAAAVVISLADTSQDKPDYNVRVTSFFPKEQIIKPTNITIVFSRDLMPDDSLEILTADPPLEIDPPLPGLAKWVDNNILRYYPDSDFRASTEYSVRIKGDRSYLYGNRINESKVFKFRTTPITVKRIRTEIINIPDPPFESKLLIHMEFNCSVELNDLLEHFDCNLRKDDRPLKFNSDAGGSASIFTFSSEPFDSKVIYGDFLVTIRGGLNCTGGNMPLARDYSQKFQVPKPAPLVINYVSSRGAGKNCVVEIGLSQTVALSEIKKFISLTPRVKYTVDQHYNRILLRGDFKPREIYTLEIRKGLLSLNGQPLERDFSTKLKIEDLQPSIRFMDDGVYMSGKGRKLLEIETVNINEITVEVEQVFPNNIVYYLSGHDSWYYGRDIGRVGRRIYYKDFNLPLQENLPMNSTFDLGSIVGDSLQGIYNIRVHQKDRRWNNIERQVMITDIGILARKSDDYLMVWVNSLSDVQPIRNAEITLLSRNNQILAERKSDGDGIVVFDNLSDVIDQSDPFLITVRHGKDLSYLRFSDCLISTAEFDVAGRPYLTRGYESFIYSDRGVYRPGEKLHMVITTRGKGGAVPEEFPYIVQIKDPRGKDFAEFKLTTGDAGISSVDHDISDYAQTGSYSVFAKIGEDIIGRYDFQVEEFMPDRIKTSLTTNKDIYITGDTARIQVNGKYLFGPPCSGNAVSGHVTIENDIFRPKEWSSFIFTDPDREFTKIETDLQDAYLDPDGEFTYNYGIPDPLSPSSMLRMTISATVKEDGGRAVSDYKTVGLHAYPLYLGLNSEFDGFVRAGEAALFRIIALDRDARPYSGDSVWVILYRTIYQTIVKKDSYGNYRYVSEREDQPLDSTVVVTDMTAVTAEFIPMEYGSYRVMVRSERTAHRSSQSFYVSGWGYSPWSMTNPDRIEMELDKNLYKDGDKAKLLVKAPFEGKLLVTIENEKVISHNTYSLDSNTAEISLPVSSKYEPNVYITATLIKSTTSLERHSPSRAFGLIPLIVDNSKKKISLSLEMPSVMKPRQRVAIKLNSNARKGAKFTVALVDVGILQLTDFSTPDPFKFFYGKKSPALVPYDIYSIIFPDIEGTGSMLTPAGGISEYESRRKRHLNPINVRRVKPVALWSGLLETDENGDGVIEMEIPQFNGKLLVSAVLIDGRLCGSTSQELTVRDKIVIQESLPRFLSPGDRLDARIITFNNTGKADNIDLSLKITDPSKKESTERKTVQIDNNQRAVTSFDYTAPNKPGKLTFDISASAGAEKARETVEMPNRPAQPLTTEHGSGVAEDGKPAKITMPDRWLEGTAEYRLKVSSLPAVRFINSIQYLLRYPYGCIEQTTSKLMPLLYFGDLAKVVEPEIFGTKGHEYFIQEGIARISARQTPSGSFEYWPGWYGYPWASVYASHALVEARKAGYWVSDDVYDRMIGFLQRGVRELYMGGNEAPLRIYAAYVLAIAGELDKSVINSLKDLDVYSLPLYTRFQLAGAIALTSGVDEALWLMPVEIHPENFSPETGGYFNCDLRANAIMIEILSEINPEHPSLPVLVKDVSERLYIGRWYSTQGNAFALMAMGKYFRSQEKPDYTGTVTIDGSKFASFTVNDSSFIIPPGMNKEIEISINGAGKCYYYWQASGISSDRTVKEFDNRLTVRRQYLDSHGKPLDSNSVALGDQVVVKITAEAMDRSLENVVINDLLPACAEIENPRLVTSARLSWIPNTPYQVDYMDIRDDRLLLFASLHQGRKLDYYYTIRITASGDFVIPPIAAECMYDPTIASAASSRSISIPNER